MNALLKHQILNAAADADRRKLPSLAAVLTDALAELERLAPFEPVTLFVEQPVVARRHEIASEQTDEMMAQAAPVAVGDALSDADLLAIHAGWQDSEDGVANLLKAVRDQTIASSPLWTAARNLMQIKDLKDRLVRSLSYPGRGNDEQEYASAKAGEVSQALLFAYEKEYVDWDVVLEAAQLLKRTS